MERKYKTLELRERLDNTLALPDLVDEEAIKSLVKDQLLRSSFGNGVDAEKVVEKRAREVSNFLGMLRSASGNKQKEAKTNGPSYNEWKIKQDTDQLRVMYREGPHGTPFHTLLTEGHADGPIDVCVCVSWESTLYKKWWPQYNIPTFKITNSTCLQKVCIGEEISLVRVKVAWPVSDREAILHYYEVEYFKEDLIIVLINTISDTEDIDISTHGFSRDGIPEPKSTVRIDLVGGFVLQKVDANRSYFRVIANMDIKLDFVPPTLINFISRQLIGNGHKLYQKAVGSVATSDEDYRQALQEPLYVRIREGMDSRNKHNVDSIGLEDKKAAALLPVEHGDNVPECVEITPVTEIVEEEAEDHVNLSSSSTNSISTTDGEGVTEGTSISPEVEHALRTLDQAIAIVRGRGLFHSNDSDCFTINGELPTSDAVIQIGPISDGDPPKYNDNLNNETTYEEGRPAKDFRNTSMGSVPKEANYGQREISQPKESLSAFPDKNREETTVTVKQAPVLESMSKVCDEESQSANGFHESGHYGNKYKANDGKKKKKRQCCLSLRFFST